MPLLLGYMGVNETILPEGFAPSTIPFEADCSDLLSYGSLEIGSPRWICTINLLIQNQTFHWLNYEARKWSRLSDLPRRDLVYKTSAWIALPNRRGDRNGGPSEDLHPLRFPSHDLFSKQSRHACPVWEPFINKLEECPGLAPGKTWVAIKRLDSFGMHSIVGNC